MKLPATLDLARRGELYPAVILHGASPGERRAAALDLARSLLCEAAPAARPCGACRHCRRIAWPEAGVETFHPDFRVLERDLKTSTSVEATKEMLKTAQLSPFEARGQVFVLAAAESLTGEAANALLKALEEPHLSAPRHFLLLAPSRLDLLPTLRSRSLSVFLGAAETAEPSQVEALAGELAPCLAAFAESRAVVYLLAAAEVVKRAGSWEDARSGRPWTLAAAALLRALERGDVPGEMRRRLLALAEALLAGPDMRMRGVAPERILEGLFTRHLVLPEPLAVAG